MQNREKVSKARQAAYELLPNEPKYTQLQKKVAAYIVSGVKNGAMETGTLMEMLGGVEVNTEKMDALLKVLDVLDVELTGDDISKVGKMPAPNEKPSPKTSPQKQEDSMGMDTEALYLQSIAQFDILTPEQERENLVAYHQDKDAFDVAMEAERAGKPLSRQVPEEAEILRRAARAKRARDTLINHNLRLVIRTARRYQGQGVEFEDLVSEGNLGLIHAIDIFDVERRNKLSTYASIWILQRISRAVSKHARTIRIPEHLLEITAKVKRAETQMAQEMGRQPTEEELAAFCGLTPKRVRAAIQVKQDVISLQGGRAEEDADQSIELADLLASDDLSPQDLVIYEQMRDLLDESLCVDLSPREEKIIRIRFGLEDNQTHTLEEIGKEFGLTRERVRQLESSALEKLSQSRNIHDIRNVQF